MQPCVWAEGAWQSVLQVKESTSCTQNLTAKLAYALKNFMHKECQERGRGRTGKRGLTNMPAGTTNKEEGPASNTCVPVYVHTCVCVCVFSNPCQSWHILQRQTEIGCSRSRRRFLYGICMVCKRTHTDTEVHRGTQSHRQWKGALAQAVANWLHCRIERVLIANDLHLAETLKVLPIEDLLDKPKQTKT